MTESTADMRTTRRGLFRSAALACVGAAAGFLSTRSSGDDTVWQIDPDKCMQCGNCVDACVLTPSAVKCVHAYADCGYCRRCTGFFELDATQLHEGAENQLCPVDAIKRTFIEDPYYQYVIDEELCVGCAKCVDGCNQFGNGSLYLQIRHDRCVGCNECAISRVCEGDAIRRVPANHPYSTRKVHGAAGGGGQ